MILIYGFKGTVLLSLERIIDHHQSTTDREPLSNVENTFACRQKWAFLFRRQAMFFPKHNLEMAKHYLYY
jgi:hypothetical protein